MEVPLWIYQVDARIEKRNDHCVGDSDISVAKAFGALLFAAREKAGLTQEALAFRSTLNSAQISQLELGNHTPRLDTIMKLAGALEIEPSELIPALRFGPRPVGKGGWVDQG
jgi:ribosome-binding protein aMBF1 (putative translation factor)